MTVVLGLGIIWTIYGTAGLLGFQRIPARYKEKSWKGQYIHACGIGWLMIGLPWLALYGAASLWKIQWPVTAVLLVCFAVPSIVYTIRIERKYGQKADEDTAE